VSDAGVGLESWEKLPSYSTVGLHRSSSLSNLARFVKQKISELHSAPAREFVRAGTAQEVTFRLQRNPQRLKGISAPASDVCATLRESIASLLIKPSAMLNGNVLRSSPRWKPVGAFAALAHAENANTLFLDAEELDPGGKYGELAARALTEPSGREGGSLEPASFGGRLA
jgi:hypothetical protein